MQIDVRPIGYVRGGMTEIIKDGWGDVIAEIELDPAVFPADALAGVEQFSHLVVVFHFHRSDPAKIEYVARHPRENPAWPKVGIFAQRGKDRPNRLGVTTCRILGVDGRRVRVQGLDAIDGTPVLDVKPHMQGFEPRGEVREPVWAGEIMARYW